MILLLALFGDQAERGLKSCQSGGRKPGYAATNPEPAVQSVPPGQSRAKLFQSVYKQLNCEKPGSKEEYELCQQWRSAEAAAQQACVTELQFWIGGLIGILGLAGLFGTVIYAAKSARAASEAAEATRDAVLSERAWLTQDGIEGVPSTNVTIDGVFYPTGFAILLNWKNTGRLPAVRANVWIDHRIVAANAPVPQFQLVHMTEERFGVIGPGSRFSSQQMGVSGDVFEQIKRGRLKWYLYSEAMYETALELGKVNRSVVCGIIRYQGDATTPNGATFPIVTLTLVGQQNDAT